MADLIAEASVVGHNLRLAERAIADACIRMGRRPEGVKICAATKYVGPEGMQSLADAGVLIAAENRLQDMAAKQEAFGDRFEWHFIGAIQSRKMLEIARRAAVVHSLATESARDKLAALETPPPRVLVQVNVSGEESKQGVAPELLGGFLGRCPIEVTGLMTMPPAVDDPEEARPYFRALAELAGEHGLAELSMGTSQDYVVAVEEGATLVRLGSVLFKPLSK